MKKNMLWVIIISAIVTLLAYRTATTITLQQYKSIIPSDKKYDIPQQQNKQVIQKDIYALP